MVIKTDILKYFGLNGIMLFPFCFVRKRAIATTIRHEKIHFKQALNLLVIPFYVLYFIEWVRCLFLYKENAYYAICFEQEAFLNAYKRNYKVGYNWIKYIIKKEKIWEK